MGGTRIVGAQGGRGLHQDAFPRPGLAARVVVNQGCVHPPPSSPPSVSTVHKSCCPFAFFWGKVRGGFMGLAGPREPGSRWSPVREWRAEAWWRLPGPSGVPPHQPGHLASSWRSSSAIAAACRVLCGAVGHRGPSICRPGPPTAQPGQGAAGALEQQVQASAAGPGPR